MDFSLFFFLSLIQSKQNAAQYLQDKMILNRRSTCCKCQRYMSCQTLNESIDGIVFRCTTCKSKRSVRAGTYWQRSKLPPQKILMLLYFWSSKATNSQISTYLKISSTTCVDHLNFIREICSWAMMRVLTKLGGVGKIVQLDESVIYKPKYNLGHGFLTPEKWIFGLYDVERKIGYVEFVEKRDRATLEEIIKRLIIPGTEIHTDKWAGYNGIEEIDLDPKFIHKTVNHSRNFVDPETGAHTNNVEAYWSSLKRKFKLMNGTSRALTPSYLDEHMYFQHFGSTASDAFKNILLHIAEYTLVQ